MSVCLDFIVEKKQNNESHILENIFLNEYLIGTRPILVQSVWVVSTKLIFRIVNPLIDEINGF